ncbi:MAG: GGDEF domain-containing protein [Sulfuricella sp.]|nr:GGDEF domain-containing protein [Sulfuricella sp.]
MGNAPSQQAPKGTAILAREALIEMAKESVPPTPENYKKYYERISGTASSDDPHFQPLLRLQNQIRGDASPHLDEWKEAIDVALAQRDWRVIEGLILKIMHTEVAAPPLAACEAPDKCKVCAEVRSFNGVLYVMESFAKNLEGLFPESPVLSGQIEIVKDLLERPRDMEKMFSAKRALAKLASPQQIQSELGEAKSFAKNLADNYLDQVGQTGNDAGAFIREVEAGKRAIEEAKDQAALLAASQSLLSRTSAVHDKMKENHTRLENAKISVQSADERIRALEDELQIVGEKAKQDYLTGLLNRHGMDEQLEKMFGEGWERVTLALLDVDDFNRIMSHQGQQAGDDTLKFLSDAIRESVGSKGVPARIGGEEFVIVFAGYDDAQVKEEMEKLQRLLTRKIFLASTDKQVVTFSAGVAQRVEEEPPSATLARADEAMYTAKRNGKNRVEIAAIF